MERFVDIKIKSYSEEEVPIFNRLLETLAINLWGEANREDGIYLREFDYDYEEDQLCYQIAVSMASISDKKIYVECSILKYIKFLYKTQQLFKKNKIVKRIGDTNKGRAVDTWLFDVSRAYNEPDTIWLKVWEYLNEK